MAIELSAVIADATAGSALTGSEKMLGDDGTALKTWLASQFATYVTGLIVNAAPSTLDTLKELADALGDDPNFAASTATALGAKAPLASPALTGTPTGPTASGGTNNTQLATTAFVVAALATRLLASNNLSDLTDTKVARVNLGVARPYLANRYYIPDGFATLQTGTAPGTNGMTLLPCYLHGKVTISALVLRVLTAAASGHAIAYVYASDPTTSNPTGAPLIVSGAIATDTATRKEDNTFSPVTFEPGLYWFGINCDASANTAIFTAPLANDIGAFQVAGVAAMLSLLTQVGPLKATITYGVSPTFTGNLTTDGLALVSPAASAIVGFKAS